MREFTVYKPKDHLKPQNLIGITQDQIEDHWELYVGYVTNVNKLNEDLSLLAHNGQINTLVFADRRRRYGFEYNGMVLHELYFANLKASETLPLTSPLRKALEKMWGSFDLWQEDFVATGKSRGIGWAILYQDPHSKQLTNHFIHDHEYGHITGFTPILVIDVWEHAYMVDHKASGRAKYVNACMQNIHWDCVQKRFKQ
jgi:Fe-Mn family superoxide dismutase